MSVKYKFLFFFIFTIISMQGQTVPQIEITQSFNLIDKTTGEKLFTTNYNFLGKFGKSSIFIAKKATKFGLIDENESIILPFEYDAIFFKRLKNPKLGLNIPYGIVKLNDRYGLLDSIGNLTTQVYFDQFPNIFNQWGGSVSVNGQFGVISPNGELLIPFEYDRDIALNGEFAIVRKNGWDGVYKLGGSLIIPTEFEGISKQFEEQVYIVRKEEKKGLYNQFGELLLPIAYDDIFYTPSFSDQQWLKVLKDKNQGIVNSKGEFIIQAEYEYISGYHPRGFIIKKEGLYGLIGKKGELLVPIQYRHYFFKKNNHFNTNLEAWRTKQRGYVVLEDGTYYDTTAFDDYQRFEKDFIILKKGNKFRIADWYGHIKPGAYDKIDCNYKTRKCFVSNDNLWGMIDYQGNLLLPLKYHGLRHLGYDYKYMTFLDKNHNVGVMNLEGIIILSAKYENIKYSAGALKDFIYRDNLAFHVKTEGKWGLVSNKEEWLIPPEYDQLYYFNNGLAPAQKRGLWGVIDKNNEVVTPFQYKTVRFSNTGLKKILIGEDWIKVDQKGTPIEK